MFKKSIKANKFWGITSHIASRILIPKYWNPMYKTDYEYSERLNQLLDDLENGEVEVEERSTCTIMIGGVNLWVSNYPYSYGHEFQTRKISSKDVIPCIKVRNRLLRIVKEYDGRI